MSYILDALRKSDQQRRRGAAPTLPAGPVTEPAPRRQAFSFYGLLALVLVGAGIAIGWLRPWQAQTATLAANVVAAKPSAENLPQSEPPRTEIAFAAEPQVHSATPAAQIAPAPAPARVQAPTADPVSARAPALATATARSRSPASTAAEVRGKPRDDFAAKSRKAAAVRPPAPGAAAAASAPAQNVISLSELPVALQQELPPMTISVHAYSGNSASRLVGINNRMLHEGDNVAPGLILEQITPEGMIFGYKGYSFRRGVK